MKGEDYIARSLKKHSVLRIVYILLTGESQADVAGMHARISHAYIAIVDREEVGALFRDKIASADSSIQTESIAGLSAIFKENIPPHARSQFLRWNVRASEYASDEASEPRASESSSLTRREGRSPRGGYCCFSSISSIRTPLKYSIH